MFHPLIIDSAGKIRQDNPILRIRPLRGFVKSISSSGWGALASAMAAPIRRNLDYQGLARKVFMVDQLPPGALPVYDKQIDIVADVVPRGFKHDVVCINSRGKVQRYRAGFVIPRFEIFSSPSIKLSDVKRRRFNMLDRTVQKARQELMSKEDDAIFRALDNIKDEE